MAGTNDLANMVPGFEFLQGLFKSAGAGLPSFGQWVAPTLDPEELDKRIQELKTVQFWLEQNARLLGTTIQALEVQRMTLNTLQTMNLPLADLGEALKIRNPIAADPATETAAPEPVAASQPRSRSRQAKAPASEGPARGAVPAAVDPVKWWGALTQQFTELATQAMKDVAPERAAAPPVAAAPKGKSRARPRSAGTR